jgi:hypothetical protein
MRHPRTGLDGFHHPRDGERMRREQDRMPVIRQENPRREEKVVFLSPLPHHAGQACEFGFLQPASLREQPTGHEKESVEQDQAAQAGHDTALYAL